jgi:hypothetical protein
MNNNNILSLWFLVGTAFTICAGSVYAAAAITAGSMLVSNWNPDLVRTATLMLCVSTPCITGFLYATLKNLNK